MNYIDILNFRYACKSYTNKKISDSDINLILEAGSLSPSSFGFEHWDFIVVKNEQVKKEIRSLSFNQAMVSACSHLVIICAKIQDFKSNSDYIKQMINRKDSKNEEEKEKRLKFYNDFLEKNFKNNEDKIFEWSHRQCMFAATNILNCAASLGIDSCPMEGFDRTKLGEYLKLNYNQKRVSLLISLGYKNEEKPQRLRRSLKDIVTYIN